MHLFTDNTVIRGGKNVFDIHCHILPDVDDGSGNLNDSIEMAQIAVGSGVSGIVATPHCNIPGVFDNYWNKSFDNEIERLNKALSDKKVSLEIYAGQEVFLSNDFESHLKKGDFITLNRSKYMLAELDFKIDLKSATEKLQKLISYGYVPIVAHPERYGFVIENPSVITKLRSAGCLVQINSGSLTGDFGRRIQKTAEEIIYKRYAVILEECSKTNCAAKILPFYSALADDNKSFVNKVRDITPEELLGREPIEVADEEILSFVKDKTIAITGGGGSIGSELCRQIAAYSPKRLIIIDVYENTTYTIQQELRAKFKDLDLKVYIATVCDYNKINSIFAYEKPDVVIHAAAHKHVPLMETVPDECVKNNVFGTLNTALATKNNGAEKFILISTDKAVNPTNIMGATKRVCEMIIQYVDSISTDTTFAAVRFGNVLGSHGSVIPLFKKQIQNRNDVTVTHPEMIRYFMTIPEASQLVLTASAMAKGGEIFVLDMGNPVKIDDLARKMIQLSGLVIGKDINIKYIGLRPGEKLYEELLMSEEGLGKTQNHKIFIGNLIKMDYNEFNNQLNVLRDLVNRDDVTSSDVEAMLMQIVPTFHRFVETDKTEDDKEVVTA